MDISNGDMIVGCAFWKSINPPVTSRNSPTVLLISYMEVEEVTVLDETLTAVHHDH